MTPSTYIRAPLIPSFLSIQQTDFPLYEKIITLATGVTSTSLKSQKKTSHKEEYKEGRKKSIGLFFFEPSTRTKISFELASKRIHAYPINIDISKTSLLKGESILDTIETLKALGCNIIVMRTTQAQVPHLLSQHIPLPFVNAGDGTNEHPTQALSDLATVFSLEKNFQPRGKKILFIGDILHSRVAHSNIKLWNLFGANVSVCGPSALLPQYFEPSVWYGKVDSFVCPFEAHETKPDIIYVLRTQKERHPHTSLGLFYQNVIKKMYQITPSIVKASNNDTQPLLLHAGPILYGVEMSPSLRGQNFSLPQVSMGLSVRAAILSILLEEASSL